MPLSKTEKETDYTIWFDGETRSGSASELLEHIRSVAARKSEEIRKLNVAQYAERIVADAAFYLPKDLLAFLRKQRFESDDARALRYLSEMESSGVRILSHQN
jgi:hypothetical protein